MRSTQLNRHVLGTDRSFAEQAFISQNRYLWCVVVNLYTMATRKSNWRTKPLIKLKDFVADDFVAESATPQQMSEAVKRELNQVESIIRTACFKRQSDRRSSKPQTGPYSRQTRAALKLLRETTQLSAPTMATASATTTPVGNSVAKSTLESLQQDPVV